MRTLRSRTARLDVIGVVQHVMALGIEGRAVVRDRRDREEFIRWVGQIMVVGKAQLLAWALVPNHI
jgi:hypothetical protein